jgi:hypothetical protein
MVMALSKQPKTRRPARPLYRNHCVGEAVPSAKLRTWQVVEARELAALGLSQRALAERYQCSQPTIHAALARKTWAEVGATEQERVDLCEQEECADEIQTTGRIVSPDGAVFANVRAAEVATGLDRIVIATALRTEGSGWTYEPGTFTPEADLWASSPWPCDGKPWPT